MDNNNQIKLIKDDFEKCRKILLAIGDETRQAIIMTLMETPCTLGLRVGEITERTHLSRPAVSHHLKILHEAGIIKMREEGAKNFYYIDVQSKLILMKNLVEHIDELLTTH